MDTQPEEFPERQAEAGDFDALAPGQRIDRARWTENVGRFANEVRGGPKPQAEDHAMDLYFATGGSTRRSNQTHTILPAPPTGRQSINKETQP